MRAVVLREFGPPWALTYEEIPDPRVGDGEVVIAVERASVTFVETQVRSGKPPNPAMLPALPAILGNGVGGVVAAVGAGVGAGLLGRRVIASLGGTGGYAERAVAPAHRLIHVPDRLTLREAVAVQADGRTALSLMDRARPGAGETVLVEAAGGGVGTLLVQLAADAGARVVAVAGGPRKVAVARELGADVAIDYREPGWVERVRKAVGPLDVVFDGVGGAIGVATFGLLRAGGRFCPFGMASGSFTPIDSGQARARGVAVLGGNVPSPAELVELSSRALEEVAAGRLRPMIGQEFPLHRADLAHAEIERRKTIGKTLLVP